MNSILTDYSRCTETAKEGAFRLGVCTATIQFWAHTGRIVALHVNKRVIYYDLSDPPMPQEKKLTRMDILSIRHLRKRRVPARLIAKWFKIGDLHYVYRIDGPKSSLRTPHSAIA